MSLVSEIVSRVDVNIDRHHSRIIESLDFHAVKEESTHHYDGRRLQAAARSLSVDSHGLLPRRKLLKILSQAQNDKLFSSPGTAFDGGGADDEQVWFLVAKFTTQTLGLVLGLLLEQSSSIDAEILYWGDILGSSLYTGQYTIQTVPSRLWVWITDICSTVRTASARANLTSFRSITGNWGLFYETVQRNVQDSLSRHPRDTLLSPFARCRSTIRQQRQALDQLKHLNASAVGILLEECLTFAGNDQSPYTKGVSPNAERCNGIYRAVILLENILHDLSTPSASSGQFEDGIFLATDNGFREKERSVSPDNVVGRLIHILQTRIPANVAFQQRNIRKHGRPSVIARYWFPAAVGLMSLSTSLRILTNRKAELLEWLSDFGKTVLDFWRNWVLQPIQKLIGTIRHDEQSEIAIMSRNSLEADRQSLERMVVDFVSDHSPQVKGENLQPDVGIIMAQVREGDLTPVLKAYERDLRKPFMGTVRGDLVRALLIQVQKTKVDVEVAMGGIDALLKSQELVFGFIGLTPGLLITYGTIRWLSGFFDSRKGFRAAIEKQQFRRAIRAIDRILGTYPPGPESVLSYKDYGLCIYEAQALKQRAQYAIPRSFLPLFEQDLSDLMDLSLGVSRQRNVLQRIQWTYSNWI